MQDVASTQGWEPGEAADDLLTRSASRLFAAYPTTQALMAAGHFPAAAWDAVSEAGLTLALLPPDAGGVGLAASEAVGRLRVAGEHLAHVPLAETMLAGWLLAGAGLAVPEGPLSVAPVLPADTFDLSQAGTGWRLAGTARRVPWGRHAAGLAVMATHGGVPHVALLSRGGWRSEPGTNLALEPRDTIHVDTWLAADAVAPAADGVGLPQLQAAGAVMRSMMIAGALTRLLRMTVDHAGQRVQFGRPIGRFQAIQQGLAVLAGQVAAARAASDIAAEALNAAGVRLEAAAIGKARTGEAVAGAVAIAHQVHGAIGFTHEHGLHLVTKRLWSWREEFGNETVWQRHLGRELAAGGADGLWAHLTNL